MIDETSNLELMNRIQYSMGYFIIRVETFQLECAGRNFGFVKVRMGGSLLGNKLNGEVPTALARCRRI